MIARREEKAAEVLFAAIVEEFGTSLDSLRATYADIAPNEPDDLARISRLLNRHSIIAAGQAPHLLYLYQQTMESERYKRLVASANRHLLAAVEAGDDHRAMRAARLLQAIVRRCETVLQSAREATH
jgi:hypothetical protein